MAAAAGLVVVVVVVSVDVAGLGFAAGTTVSSFFSHAASNATLASMQMYFFMICLWETQCGSKSESEQDLVSALHKIVFHRTGSYLRPCASATAAIVNLPSCVLIPPRRVGCFSQAPANP